MVAGGDKLGVLIFMELIRSRLQHALLQLNTPLELYITKRTERHEEAEQPLLMGTNQEETERRGMCACVCQ